MADESNHERSQVADGMSAPADAPVIQTPPEFAFADDDVRGVISGEIVAGTSLWRDAWRRLLKNKLAVISMLVVLIVAVLSFAGPTLIQKINGYTYDFIPQD